MDVARVLERAADLIEPEGAWIRYYLARTAGGEYTMPLDPRAVSFCALGAVERAAGTEPSYEAVDFFESQIDGRNITEWNNDPERTQGQVVSALRSAAALARGE